LADVDVMEKVRTVEADIVYLLPDGPKVNRRFVAPGVEVNTGRYGPYRVRIRDGRPIKDSFTLDEHGFVLKDHVSQVRDFFDKEEVDRIYPGEVVEAVKAWTGASFVAPLGWMCRTSGDLSRHVKKVVGYTHSGGVQPPAGEAHVDTEPLRIDRTARATYEKVRPGGPGFSRFIYSSFWKTFSEPPQDWPLALCEAGSVRPDEGVPNTLFVVDEIPEGEALVAPIPGEDERPAAAIFHHNPDHRWWYFSNMTRDEAVLLKFHDSDKSRAWRVPHTAFHDTSFPDAKPRSSVEFRTIAFFED
jgi:hypothetical protein